MKKKLTEYDKRMRQQPINKNAKVDKDCEAYKETQKILKEAFPRKSGIKK